MHVMNTLVEMQEAWICKGKKYKISTGKSFDWPHSATELGLINFCVIEQRCNAIVMKDSSLPSFNLVLPFLSHCQYENQISKWVRNNQTSFQQK